MWTLPRRPRLCAGPFWAVSGVKATGQARPVSRCPWRPLPEPTPGSRSQPPVPQEELENFPLPSVRHSQTVLNQLRYPSVLLLVCQDSDQSKPDVHFFHCDEVEVRRAAVGSGGARPS